jgi:hypothetical protein
MEFDGSGDSGEFQSATASDSDGGTINLADDLDTTCIEWGEHRLDELGYDWYNNEGGYGSIILYADGSGEINTHLRVIETQDYADDP